MRLGFLNAALSVKTACGKEYSVSFHECPVGKTCPAESEALKASLCISEEAEVMKASLSLQLLTGEALEAEKPVQLVLTPAVQPDKVTAMYLHKDWWTRPGFFEGIHEMPERTQAAYLQGDGYEAGFLFNAGERFKTNAYPGEEGKYTLILTAMCEGLTGLSETLFYYAEAKAAPVAMKKAAAAAAAEHNISLASEKELPEMFEYLGWCSWNAFYTDITEEKVREKAKELKEKQVPVRWILMDDGWLANEGRFLTDYRPDKTKFPNAFKDLCKDLKEDGRIMKVGVWHAFPGYWEGILPGSLLEKESEGMLYRSAAGHLVPRPDAAGYEYYARWYEYLKAQGIDFVKVDGQSDLYTYYDRELPLCEAGKGIHRNLEGAVGAYMRRNIINCMGMAMESVFSRPDTALSRNSDDFFPDLEDSFTEHMKQNAYNSLYHNAFQVCDWDMFFTFHKDAAKHVLLRAISGSPVYFSDRIGETVREAVTPLCFEDGRLLRMERSAVPAPECLFNDPEETGYVKITNIGHCGLKNRKAGAEAIFNLSDAEKTFTVSAEDIYDLPAGEYICYYREEKRILSSGEEIRVAAGKAALVLFVPAEKGSALVGLSDKYMSPLAAEEVKIREEGFTAILTEGGKIAFSADYPVHTVKINGADAVCEKVNGLYFVNAACEGKAILSVNG